MKRFNHITILLFGLLISCSTNRSIEKIVDTHTNLQGIHEIYPNDPKKRELLYYLVKNSKTENLPILNLDSLKYTIDISYNTWLNSKWSKEYTFDHFKEYVLPMSISQEPIEYYWREDILNDLQLDKTINDIETFARSINNQVHINGHGGNMSEPQKGYSRTKRDNWGKCDDRAILTVMNLRTAGIPSAFDYIPYWGSSNNGHSLTSAIMPNDSIIVFQAPEDKEDVFIYHKAPKIYRQTYSKQPNSIISKYISQESIPPIFSDLRYIDVTHLYSIGQQNVEVELAVKNENKIVYMSVFSPQGWRPVAYSQKRGERASFEHLGNGLNQIGDISTDGYDIGNGILYLPCYYADGEIIPASNPYIVSKSGVYTIEANKNETESVVLYRKFPLMHRIKSYAQQIAGGIIEVANRADFSDSKIIHYIGIDPYPGMKRVKIDIDGEYKYIRYRKPNGSFGLAELKVLNKLGREINGRLVTNRALIDEPDTKYIVDGDPLTYYSTSAGMNLWAGLEFKEACDIGFVEYAPRNDDNNISIGEHYELFYWDSEWLSLGEKIADDYTLTYDNVPKGALLWLRNLTRGREERPFIYRDGVQIWW